MASTTKRAMARRWWGSAALAAALAEVPQQAALLQNVQQAARPHSLAVEDTAALRRLLGGRLTLSPTRIERCHTSSLSALRGILEKHAV